MNDRYTNLPEDGPARQIFINALHEYRNSCEPPALTPGCPYFRWTSNGPACGEQCADLLAQYDDQARRKTVDLGDGIALVRNQPRRRPRRKPDSSSRPFDARQIFLDNDNRAHADRDTVALIVELTTLITTPPELSQDASERSYDIKATREQLETRGFNTDSLIRYGLGATLPMYFAALSIFAIAKTDGNFRAAIDAVGSLSDFPQPSEEWLKFFNYSYKEDNKVSASGYSSAYYALHGFIDRIRDWLEVASIEDIIAWIPPAHYPVCVDVPALHADSVRNELHDIAIWMIDRFTVADLSAWSLASLRLEWKYLHGNLKSPCSPAAMAERKVDAQEVSGAIADEISTSNDEEISTANKLIPVALEHLRNGKPEIAAAIFEAIVAISPEDSDAHNNLGFCMLPIDPSAALPELDLADKLSGGTFVTLANRVLALHLTGRNADALNLAKSDRVSDLPSGAATMWSVEDHRELSLIHVDNVRTYLASVVTHIESEHGV
jgi:hypothetical protein